MPLRRRLILMLSSLVLLILVAACGFGGGDDGPACTGWVEHQGTRYGPESSTSDGEARAQELACNVYCREGDPEYEAMYQIWLDSPRGDPSVTREQAIFEDESLMRFVTETCQQRCVADVGAGTLAGGVDCP